MASRPSAPRSLRRHLRQSESQVELALGLAAQAQRTPRPGVAYKVDLKGLGSSTYEGLRLRLAHIVCDRRTGNLKDWAQELLDGDLRDLAVAVLAIACSQLSVVLSVAVPFAALVAKRGLHGI